jgi:hypothetical protein
VTAHDADPAALRRRAAALRALAARVEEAAVHRLAARAGPDTWRGPVADELAARLVELHRRADAAVDELRWHAVLLERQADAHAAELGAGPAAG